MYNIYGKYRGRLTQSIIDRYINLEKLDAAFNSKITNVNHLTKLEILDAFGINCGINDAGLVQCVNLKSLNVSYNRKITEGRITT